MNSRKAVASSCVSDSMTLDRHYIVFVEWEYRGREGGDANAKQNETAERLR